MWCTMISFSFTDIVGQDKQPFRFAHFNGIVLPLLLLFPWSQPSSTSFYLKMTRRDDDMQKETTDFYCNGRVITDALLLIVCLMRLYLYYFSGRSSLEIQWILSPMTIRRSVSWFAIDGWAQEGRYLEGNAELRKVCTHACDTRIQQKQYLCIISQGSAT